MKGAQTLTLQKNVILLHSTSPALKDCDNTKDAENSFSGLVLSKILFFPPSQPGITMTRRFSSGLMKRTTPE